jgi:hypothetical protein
MSHLAPIKQNSNLTQAVLPPVIGANLDFATSGNGYVGHVRSINTPVPAIVRKDQTILSVEMIKKLYKRYGPGWRKRLSVQAERTITPSETLPEHLKAPKEQLVLHGKEIVLSSAESQVLATLLKNGRL